jgi:hypothetical protein
MLRFVIAGTHCVAIVVAAWMLDPGACAAMTLGAPRLSNRCWLSCISYSSRVVAFVVPVLRPRSRNVVFNRGSEHLDLSVFETVKRPCQAMAVRRSGRTPQGGTSSRSARRSHVVLRSHVLIEDSAAT